MVHKCTTALLGLSSERWIPKYSTTNGGTVLRDGAPWFVAADVCRVLEIANSSDAVARLDEDEKDVVLTDTLGDRQNVSIINEPGLYAPILGSRKPEAKMLFALKRDF